MNSSPFTAIRSKIQLPIGLIIGIICMLTIINLPLHGDLSLAGQRMLAILAFAVIVWITEAVSYEVSALMIFTLIIGLLYGVPTVKDPALTYKSMEGLKLALSGFSNPALGLVVGALFLAATMSHTGLDQRIALFTLSKIGTSTHRILIGTVVVTFLLSLVVPSSTARSACLVAIMMGMITSFNLPLHANLSAAIMMTVAQATNIWNVGIQTAAAQNVLGVGFIHEILGQRITWLEWFIAGAPWAIIMSLFLIWLVIRLLPDEGHSIAEGKEVVVNALYKLGPMNYAQKYLLIVAGGLLLGWATEGKFHHIDTASILYLGLLALLFPKIGAVSWPDIQKRIPWGVVIVFGAGISLGTALVYTEAAKWLGTEVAHHLPSEYLGIISIFAILSAFLIIIHLGFASATALCSAILPIMIAVLQSIPGDFNHAGISMILTFAISFGFILPINAPQNIICLATDTFSSHQFIKIGLIITLVGYGLMMLMANTYWKWLGYF